MKSKEYQIPGTDFHAVAAFACMEAEEVMVETASVVVVSFLSVNHLQKYLTILLKNLNILRNPQRISKIFVEMTWKILTNLNNLKHFS